MVEFFVLVPPRVLATIEQGGPWGAISAQMSEPEQLARVAAVSAGGDATLLPVESLNRSHFMSATDTRRIGRWVKVDAYTQVIWAQTRYRAVGITLQGFRDIMPVRVPDPGEHIYIVLTYAPDMPSEYAAAGIPSLTGWTVSTSGVRPVVVDIDEPLTIGEQLADRWPIEDLQHQRVCVIGAGSIGSAAAHGLATYGIGTLDLVDPDRLLRYNLIRHTSSSRQVGKLKVNALKEDLERQRPDTHVNAYPLNVLDDANTIRKLLEETDLVVCTTDGVTSRRVTGHLARRARKDGILACVLEDGALGEIIRLRPWPDRGCITCCRTHHQLAGAFDPEPGINRPYGEGTHHRPMTAVGADLHLVGAHAAKMAVATLLQAKGFNEQRLPSDHLIIALRPAPMWPTPYDVRRCGEVKWLDPAPPQPDCPTCNPIPQRHIRTEVGAHQP
ncbi:Molybdopterin-synthase adenylyltransferase [Mycobacterium marinum]|uniref:ThiF family adenylyltransferase n=1 Tax=Mycobacterium marinum TaxID=1781 RepID=UPI000E3D9CD2|nr:ThiF family adenylyltransferase [Mycobacterium marinum]RFZ48545.1 Molybdopterin-synthase adenylyltransferase [Mycobacterium marinum]